MPRGNAEKRIEWKIHHDIDIVATGKKILWKTLF